MNYYSCIKIPVSREAPPSHRNPSTRETDIRDQLCGKNELITLANEAFGVNKWSHVITSQTLDFIEYQSGKYLIGCVTFIKVQLEDGTYHEDMGYNSSDGLSKGLVIFSARNSSIVNALRNTLMCFGGVIATKIEDFIKKKLNESKIVVSPAGISKSLVIPKPRIVQPQDPSTSQKTRSSPKFAVPARPPINITELPPPVIKIEKIPAQNVPQVDKSDEEKKLDRKRRQAQKQAEYRKLLKAKECGETSNPKS